MKRNPKNDRVFQALGDPTRRAMLERLNSGPMSVSFLAEPFDMSLAAVVQHLQILQHAGLVKTEKVGRVRSCRVEASGMQVAEEWLRAGKRRLHAGGVVLCALGCGGNREGKKKNKEAESKTHENLPSKSNALTKPCEGTQDHCRPGQNKTAPASGSRLFLPLNVAYWLAYWPGDEPSYRFTACS